MLVAGAVLSACRGRVVAGEPIGACCEGTFSCLVISEAGCVDEGHTWLGAGTTCDQCPELPSCPATGVLLGQGPYDPLGEVSASTSENGTNLSVFDHYSGAGGAIESLTWWGLDVRRVGNHFEECTESNNSFFIAFHEDAGGVPGDFVCGYGVVASRTPLNIRYNGMEMNEYNAALPLPCILTQGWLSITGGGEADCWFLWITSPTGDNLSYCDGCQPGPMGSDFAWCLEGEAGGIYGACCEDASATCMDEKVEITQCLEDDQRFIPNATCDSINPPCGIVYGACCMAAQECTIERQRDCDTLGGSWIGANTLCSQCPCIAFCPPHGSIELEPACGEGFVDTTNGGCSLATPAFLSIEMGDVICGRAGFFEGASGLERDEDWYQLTVEGPTDIYWEVTAEFTAQISIYDATGGCPGTLLDSITGPPCFFLSLFWFAQDGGTYWLVVESAGTNDVDACPAQYTATVPFPNGCAPGDVNLDNFRDGRDVSAFVDCLLLGGTPGGNCACADMNGADGTTTADIPAFVAVLIGA